MTGHEAYDRGSPVQWFLGRPSKDLKAELLPAVGAARAIALPAGGAEVLDIGCGDGRDTLFLASLGHRATGVDIGAPAIQKARETQAKASAAQNDAGGQLFANLQFVHYDVLQLPAPQAPLDLIWDNTIYCNLRIEFLAEVLALLGRLTTPGRTFYLLNCGNANAPEIVGGHPRLREATIRRELGGLFDFLKVYEGHYDMKMSTKALKRRASRWNLDNQAVLSWTVVMRRKKLA